MILNTNKTVEFRHVTPCSLVSIAVYQAIQCHTREVLTPLFVTDNLTVYLYMDPPGDGESRSRAGDLSVRRAGTD